MFVSKRLVLVYGFFALRLLPVYGFFALRLLTIIFWTLQKYLISPVVLMISHALFKIFDLTGSTCSNDFTVNKYDTGNSFYLSSWITSPVLRNI